MFEPGYGSKTWTAVIYEAEYCLDEQVAGKNQRGFWSKSIYPVQPD
jgi:endonuclease YncB( thermonuclease family)